MQQVHKPTEVVRPLIWFLEEKTMELMEMVEMPIMTAQEIKYGPSPLVRKVSTKTAQAAPRETNVNVRSPAEWRFVAPICAKIALHLSGSYSDKLEEIEPVADLDENGNPKNAAELLIERIQKIQEELPSNPVNEDEAAFTNAAEEDFSNLAKQQRFHSGPFRRT